MHKVLYLFFLFSGFFIGCSVNKPKVLEFNSKKILPGQKLIKPYYTFQLKLVTKDTRDSQLDYKILYGKDTIDTRRYLQNANTSAKDTIILSFKIQDFDTLNNALILMYPYKKSYKMKRLPPSKLLSNQELSI